MLRSLLTKKQTIDRSRTIGITKSNVDYLNNNIVNIEKLYGS